MSNDSTEEKGSKVQVIDFYSYNSMRAMKVSQQCLLSIRTLSPGIFLQCANLASNAAMTGGAGPISKGNIYLIQRIQRNVVDTA